MCNWPWASAPCEEPETDSTTEDGSGGGEDVDEIETDSSVIVSPTFDYECSNEGIFPHESNCHKFWLCKGK